MLDQGTAASVRGSWPRDAQYCPLSDLSRRTWGGSCSHDLETAATNSYTQ